MHEINPNAKYPDLEWLTRVFRKHRIECHEEGAPFLEDTSVYIFPQWWPNTGGGFAQSGYMYGQAMIKQHTTVILSDSDCVAMVCFDNQPAYFVDGIFGQFYEDLDNHHICGLSETWHYVGDGGRVVKLCEECGAG